uniref:Inner membrane protein n=1 Tax=Candidatus Kentrum sp. FW TaxID=2126338 RepID=A0A450TVC8_9GAMM|nr:MAG: hypothetical protein BECKFW1821C_GA0114237_104124 [Candidatus Kentron sp. FW]
MTGQQTSNGSVRVLLIILGTLCVALGVLGMLLPLLPTTPFLLLAATCYSRSSERFYRWLVTNRWCGENIRNYREGLGIPLKQKVLAILVLWLVIGSTAWLATSRGWIRWILLCVAVGVTVYLVKMKTCKPKATPGPLLRGNDVSAGETRKGTADRAERQTRRCSWIVKG